MFYGDEMMVDGKFVSEFASGCNLSRYLLQEYDEFEIFTVDALYYLAPLIQGLSLYSESFHDYKVTITNVHKSYSIRDHQELDGKTLSEGGKSDLKTYWDTQRPE